MTPDELRIAARQRILFLLWQEDHDEITWKRMVRDIRQALTQVQRDLREGQ